MEESEEAWIEHGVLNGKCEIILNGKCDDLTKSDDSHMDIERCFQAVKRIALAAGEVGYDGIHKHELVLTLVFLVIYVSAL